MRTLTASVIVALSLFVVAENSLACNGKTYRCKTRAVVYYPVAYAVPVYYQACPCSGTWGSPSCNCPDVYVQPTSCDTCGMGQIQTSSAPIPGHWHGTEYEVYYATPSTFPTPTSFEGKDVGYAVDGD